MKTTSPFILWLLTLVQGSFFSELLHAQGSPPAEITVEVAAGVTQDFSPPATATTLVKTGNGTLNLVGIGEVTLLKVQSGIVNVLPSINNSAVVIQASGGQIGFEASQKFGALAILAGGRVELAPGGNLVLEVAALSIDPNTGSALDLMDNTLILTYGTTTPVAEVTQWAVSGLYDGATGFWDGPGIRSTTAATDVTGLRAVAVVDNNDQGWPLLEEFPVGRPLALNSIVVTCTRLGDANLDLLVTAADYSLIDYGLGAGLHGWFFGDFNYDGSVTAADYGYLDFGYSGADYDGDGSGDGIDAFPFDYYNGQAPVLARISGNGQMAAQGGFMANPLTVRVTTSNGEPLVNAPVTFSLGTSPGNLALSIGGQLRSAVAVRTNAVGLASVFYLLPGAPSISATVSVSAGTATPLTFAEWSDSDVDGMPDVWEDQFGLNKYYWLDRLEDADDDQAINLDEYLAGTDPTDPFDGNPPVIVLLAGDDQLARKGQFFASAIRVRVDNSSRIGIRNITVVFSSAAGEFSASKAGAPLIAGSVSVPTGVLGVAETYFRGPDSFLTNTSVVATVTYGGTSASTTIALRTLGDPVPLPNPDNTTVQSWTDNFTYLGAMYPTERPHL